MSYWNALPDICDTNEGAAVQYGLSNEQCHTIGVYDPDYDDQASLPQSLPSSSSRSSGLGLT